MQEPEPSFPATVNLLPPKLLLTVLQFEGQKIPVYWIHYVCWQAIARKMSGMMETPDKTQVGKAEAQISRVDMWWIEMSLC